MKRSPFIIETNRKKRDWSFDRSQPFNSIYCNDILHRWKGGGVVDGPFVRVNLLMSLCRILVDNPIRQ